MLAFDHRRGRHVEVQGARIHRECLGPADPPVVVLLHGGLGNMEDLSSLLPALEGRRLMASTAAATALRRSGMQLGHINTFRRAWNYARNCPRPTS